MKKATSIIIVVLLVAVMIYDFVAIQVGGTEASVSSILINFAYKMPIFTFSTGVVCGHLFWRMRTNTDTKKIDEDHE